MFSNINKGNTKSSPGDLGSVNNLPASTHPVFYSPPQGTWRWKKFIGSIQYQPPSKHIYVLWEKWGAVRVSIT